MPVKDTESKDSQTSLVMSQSSPDLFRGFCFIRMKLELKNGLRKGRIQLISDPWRENNYTFCQAKCDCGNIFKMSRTGFRNSLGKCCIKCRAETRRKFTAEEQHLKSILSGMKERCYNKKQKCYIHYGGRGITIHDQWLNDRTSFVEWALANGYKKGLTIDRINNDGNYEPSNCRWATRSDQLNNTRRTIRLTINGETKTLSEWQKESPVSAKNISERLRYGMAPFEAVYSPKIHQSKRHYKKTPLPEKTPDVKLWEMDVASKEGKDFLNVDF